MGFILQVRESLIPGAGEGLFAKRRLEAGQLIAYFAGVQVNLYDALSTSLIVLFV